MSGNKKSWTPELRAAAGARIKAAMARDPEMNLAGRLKAMEIAKTPEGRARQLAALKKARAVYRAKRLTPSESALDRDREGCSLSERAEPRG